MEDAGSGPTCGDTTGTVPQVTETGLIGPKCGKTKTKGIPKDADKVQNNSLIENQSQQVP